MTFRWDDTDAIDVDLEDYHQERAMTASIPARPPVLQPAHPGALLREDVLPPPTNPLRPS
jgi:hypothetical protein